MESAELNERIVSHRRRQRRHRLLLSVKEASWTAAIGGLFLLMFGGVTGLLH